MRTEGIRQKLMENATLFKGRVQDPTKVERGNVTQCAGYESTVEHILGIYPGTTVTEEVGED
jgi:hypothetical protein